jgi:hypothetical protein
MPAKVVQGGAATAKTTTPSPVLTESQANQGQETGSRIGKSPISQGMGTTMTAHPNHPIPKG